MDVVLDAAHDTLLMAWQLWWALVLGFAISAVVQVRVPRARVERSLSGTGVRPIAAATGLGAASSSCSYAAVAIARSLFAKGASAASTLAFQFASTNLVWELGLVLWLLIGWQFALAEYLGGLVMIALMAAGHRLLISRRLEDAARDRVADDGQGDGAEERSWHAVAVAFRSDWSMLHREILVGVGLAGAIAQLGRGVFDPLLLRDAPSALRTIENVVIGPVIAILSFVCSVGNVPLAAVLWSQGMSFAGVLAFLFADLVVLPIISIYRRTYGPAFAARITALMLATMPLAALLTAAAFSVAGAVPAQRPSADDIFGEITLNYRAVLNVLATLVFAALFWASREHRSYGSSTTRAAGAHPSRS